MNKLTQNQIKHLTTFSPVLLWQNRLMCHFVKTKIVLLRVCPMCARITICVTSWNQKGWKPGFYELTQICRRVSVRGVGDELFGNQNERSL